MPVITKLAPGSPSGGGSGAGGGGPLSTRRGTIAAAGVVALLAGLVLLFALQQYRGSVAGEGEAARVIVANGLIPQGSSGDVLSDEELITVTEVRADQLQEGAITDPAALRGQVALQDIQPNQQLAASDFGPASSTIQSALTGEDRAVGVAVEGAQGVSGALRPGDRVDVLVGFNTRTEGSTDNRPVVKTLMQNVLVLRVGTEEAGEGEEDVIVRAAASSVPELVYGAENGTVYLALRPGAGARDPEKELVGLETVLLGEAIPTGSEGQGGDDE